MSTNQNFNQSPLSAAERQELAERESTFLEGASAPFEMGRAVQEIRDRRLYREDGPEFAEYCETKLHCSRSYADRLIGAWRVYALLTPIGVKLENECQARPLMSLSDEQVLAVGHYILQNCRGRRLTGEDFKRAAEQVRPEVPPRPKPAKTPKLTAKIAAQALRLVAVAEAASQQDDKAALLEALTALKECLTGPEAKPATETTAKIATAPPRATAGPTQNASPGDVAPLPNSRDNPSNCPPPAPVSSPTNEPTIAARSNGPMFLQNPAEILIDQTASPITKWNEVPVFVANWLLDQRASLPPEIHFIKRDQSLFSRSARLRTLRDGSYMEIGDDCKALQRKARRLLNASGHSQLSLTVRLNSGQTINL